MDYSKLKTDPDAREKVETNESTDASTAKCPPKWQIIADDLNEFLCSDKLKLIVSIMNVSNWYGILDVEDTRLLYPWK